MSNRNSERGPWIAAWVLSLLLHAVAIIGLRLPPPQATAARADTVMVQLMPGGNSPAEDPQFFTELPADRADQAPAHADFLSNVTSRARDRVPGGDAALPRLEGDADVPQVKLERKGAPTSTGAQRSVLARPGAAESRPLDPADESSVRDPESAPPASGATSPRPPGSAGSSGVPQPEMSYPGGNAALSGEVSLNTLAWNYAPWLERFRNQLMQRWFAPSAYYLGILKEGGWGLFEVEISRSGKVLRLDRLDEQGHPSLAKAAEGALRNMVPIEPLPADFPEPTLILRIRMFYPAVRSR